MACWTWLFSFINFLNVYYIVNWYYTCMTWVKLAIVACLLHLWGVHLSVRAFWPINDLSLQRTCGRLCDKAGEVAGEERNNVNVRHGHFSNQDFHDSVAIVWFVNSVISANNSESFLQLYSCMRKVMTCAVSRILVFEHLKDT